MKIIKYRVRNTVTGKIVGHEALFPTETDSTHYEWARTVNGVDWTKDAFSGNDLQREQFTGVKDKNGIEVYEDDILDIDNHRYEVVWVFAGFYCDKMGVGEGMTLDQVDSSKQFLVIGNRFENPNS